MCIKTIRVLSESLPDALANDCSKCSEKQKTGSDKVVRYLINEVRSPSNVHRHFSIAN